MIINNAIPRDKVIYSKLQSVSISIKKLFKAPNLSTNKSNFVIKFNLFEVKIS